MTKFLIIAAILSVSFFSASACPSSISTTVQDCNSFVFHLDNTPVGNVTWNFGDGATTTGSIEIAHNYEVNGLFTVTATFSGPDCPDGITLTTMVIADCAPAPQCPTEIWSGAGAECGVMNFEIGSFVDGENVIWYPGDETGAVTSGHFFSHTYANPGTYNVCAFYTSPICPGGVDLCTEVVVEACNTNLCPTGVVAETIDCNTYVFHVQGVDNADVIWNFEDGTTISGGINAEHTWTTNGVYIVTAQVSAPQCPIVPPTNVITFVYTVQIDCAPASACPTEISSGAGAECGVMNFEIGSFVDGENVIWYPGDETGAVTSGHFFSHTYANPGTYNVCAFYTSSICPGGVDLCTVVVVEACNTISCPSEINSNPGTVCGVMNFEIGSFVEGENVVWYPGDETGAVTSGHFFSHTYANPGTYTVCAFYTTPLCPDGVELCITITVEACNQPCNEIGFGIDSYLLEGGTPWLTYMISNVESGILVTSGVAEYTENDPYFDTPLCLPDGCYYLSIDNNNPLLIGQGVNVFFILNSVNLMENATIIYQDEIAITYLIGVNTDCAGPPSCEAAFEPVYTATPGHIEFVNNSTFNGIVEFLWDYGNGTTSDGPNGNVQYESNGVYTVCLTVTTGNCTNTSCQVVVVDNMETPCEFNEVTLYVQANYFEPVINEIFDLVITNSGLPITNLTFETNGNLNDTLTFCVPDGCYEVQLNSDLPIQAISFVCNFVEENTQQLGELQLSIGESSTSTVVGVNMDCTIDVEETNTTSIQTFPNPASDHIQFVSNELIHQIEIFDMTGKYITSFNPNQKQTQVNIANWSEGIYVAHVIDATGANRILVKVNR